MTEESTANIFCSIIIPSIGRHSLARAVESALDQSLPEGELEVIVVNDSGVSLPPAGWQSEERVRIIQTYRRERSFARNSGAALARGDYLYFLDDDDWLLPGALAALQQLARQAPEAGWLYGGVLVVDESEIPLGESNAGFTGNCLAQIMGGAWVPIQASLVRADSFFAVGGYDPHISGTEDQDLCRRIAARFDLANTGVNVGCLYRGAGWETSTAYRRAPEDTRVSRDAVVSQPGVFGRLIGSAGSAYWYGRIFRIYFSLFLWQLRRRKLFTALSRLFFGLATLLLAGPRALTPSFWHAFRAAHVPGTLHFIERQMAAS